MKRFRHIICFLAMAVLTAGLAGGCQKKPGENIVIEEEQVLHDGGDKVLTFFGYKTDSINLVAIEEALHGFMEQNPQITVVYEGVKGGEYWEAFEKRDSSGNMDDIMMINRDHALSMIKEHKLVDLSDLPAIEAFDTLAQGQFVREDGCVYFIPTYLTSYGLYVNLEMLKEHGQEIPTNLEELTRVCDYFVSRGITPIVANNRISLKCIMLARGMYPVYQQENPKEDLEKFSRDKAALVETLRPGIETAAMMLKKGWIDCEEALEAEVDSDEIAIFAEGNRPFMIGGAWSVPRVRAMNEGLSFEVYPFPVLDDGSVLLVDCATCIGISASSENIEDAKHLIEYMTQTDVMWEFCESQSSFSPLKDERMPSDSAIKPSAECLQSGRIVIGSDNNLKLPLDTALLECGTRMMKGAETDEIIKQLSELLEAEN